MNVGILIVEDDPEIAGFLSAGLTVEGYRVAIARDGTQLSERMSELQPALIVLDRRLPDADGIELCRSLRATGSTCPILMLTAKDAVEDRIEGLRAGADDYITKPFAFGELVARIEALLRRAGQGEPAMAMDLVVGDLRMEFSRKIAFRGERLLTLTTTEFALLRCLAQRSGQVVSRAEILSTVWGYEFDPNTNIVEVYINYLRKKVELDATHRMIVNVRGVGYRLEPEPIIP